MKFWCFLFTACVIQSGFGSYAKYIAKKRVAMASVTYTYSGIPKCSGTFVSTDTLLTSATCLFCDQDCDMKVEILDPYTSELLHYDINEILIHEKYELQPTKNDIGLIKINGKVPSRLVIEIRDLQNNPANFPTYYYTIKFHNGAMSIQSNKTTLITNAKCSHILHTYIPSDNICVYSTNDFHFQEQSQGSPLVYEYRGKLYLTAIYVPEKQNYAGGSRIAIFERIGLEIPWINRHAKNTPFVHCHSSNHNSEKVSVTKAPAQKITFPDIDSVKIEKVPLSKATPPNIMASTISPTVIPFSLFTLMPYLSSDSPSILSREPSSLNPNNPFSFSETPPSKYASSSYVSSPHAYSPKAPSPQGSSSQASSTNSYSLKAPAPQSSSPHAYSPKAPAPQASSPHAYSPKAPAPQASSPHAYSPKAPAPQASSSHSYSLKAPTPQTSSPHAYSPKAPAPQASSSHSYSLKAPTPQASSPHAYSPKAPAPQGSSSHSYSLKAPTPQSSSPHAYSPKAPQASSPHSYSLKAPTPHVSSSDAYSPKTPAPQASPPKAPSQNAPGYPSGHDSYTLHNPAKHHEYEEKRNLLEYNPQYYQ